MIFLFIYSNFKIKNQIKEIANSKIGTYPLQAVIDQMKNIEEKKSIISNIMNFIYKICIVNFLI